MSSRMNEIKGKEERGKKVKMVKKGIRRRKWNFNRLRQRIKNSIKWKWNWHDIATGVYAVEINYPKWTGLQPHCFSFFQHRDAADGFRVRGFHRFWFFLRFHQERIQRSPFPPSLFACEIFSAVNCSAENKYGESHRRTPGSINFPSFVILRAGFNSRSPPSILFSADEGGPPVFFKFPAVIQGLLWLRG